MPLIPLLVSSAAALLGADISDSKLQSENLIPAPSFDKYVLDDGLPPGWKVRQEPNDAFEWYLAPQGHDAERSLELNGTGTGPGCRVEATFRPWTPGTRRGARAWVWMEPGSTGEASLLFEYADKGGGWIGQSESATLTAADFAAKPGEWLPVAIDASPRRYPHCHEMRLALRVKGPKARVRWDNVDLFEYWDRDRDNLLGNGSGENRAGERVLDWTVAGEAGDTRLTVSEREPLEGWSCIRFVGSKEQSIAGAGARPLAADRKFHLTGSLRAAKGSGRAVLAFLAGEKIVAEHPSDAISAAGWTKFDVRGEAPESADRVRVLLVSGNNDFDLEADDLRLLAE